MKEPGEDAVGSDDTKDGTISGSLLKWTNYVEGWQRRWLVLKAGVLSYYRSEAEQAVDCRGSLCLHGAEVEAHPVDEARFQVSLHDHTWHFRATSAAERGRWLRGIRESKLLAGSSDCDCRYLCKSEDPSARDLLQAISVTSQVQKELKEHLVEIADHEAVLKAQLDRLQEYFGMIADLKEVNNDFFAEDRSKMRSSMRDFKTEAACFKMTSEATIKVLKSCVNLISEAEERFEREAERRESPSKAVAGNPDLEEGPHGPLQREEFFDALESSLERLEEEATLRELLRRNSVREVPLSGKDPREHPLWPEIQRVTALQLENVRAEDTGVGWKVLLDDGKTRMTVREVDGEHGNALDPLRLVHTVEGVSAAEVCRYFFGPQYRQDWETTLERMEVVEKISDDILVFHQVHKRVWPAAQRDALFWSRLVRPAEGGWAVVNHSTDCPIYPNRHLDCVRLRLDVCLHSESGPSRDRRLLRCTLRYCSLIDPGGWAPAFVVRSLFKKEYPKFLKRFSDYVKEKTKDEPIDVELS